MITILLYHFILLTQIFLVCRNKTVRIKEMLQTFAVGATMGVFGNFIIQGIFSHFFSGSTVSYTIGPISEEFFKIAFVAFLLFKTRMGKTIAIEDGALLGAAAGAGFGFTEDSVRAIGHGLSFMSQGFSGYTFSMLPSIITSWLPSERSLTSIVDGQFIAGHLVWTGFIGLGLAFMLRFKNFKGRIIVPIFLFLWACIDHSLANNAESFLGFLYPLYGYGMGTRYAFTALLIGVVVLDNRLINRFLPDDKTLLIPGEKKRSFFKELLMTILNFRFGFGHVKELTAYFSLRRQLAIALSEKENIEALKDLLQKSKINVIASVRFGKAHGQEISEGIRQVWRGPSPRFNKLSMPEKIGLFVLVISGLSSLFVGWLMLFSLYLPHGVTLAIVRSPFFIILGSLGYVVAAWQFIEFYKKKQWQKESSPLDRVGSYANTVLVNSSVVTGFIFVPGFFGRGHPLLGGVFFWGQFNSFWNSLAGSQQWVGGTVSAAIGFIPIIGNIKSGYEAVVGYDNIAGQKVEGWNRVLSVVGAIPLVGNAAKGLGFATKLVKTMKVVHVAEAVDKVAGYVNFGNAAKGDFQHAFTELGKELSSISAPQTKAYASVRSQIIQQWQDNGGMKSIGHGSYATLNKRVEVYMEKEGVHTLGLRVGDDHIGQVSIDHSNKSVMFDMISSEHGQSSQTLDSTITSLHEKFPDYTVMQRHAYEGGFSRYDVVLPDGASSQFYSVPTLSSHNVGVSAVASR